MKFLVKAVPVVVNIIFWNVTLQLFSKCNSCLVGPAPGHIFRRVPSTSEHYCRQIVSQHVFKTSSMPFNTEVKSSQLIMAKTVCTQLHNNRVRPVFGHNSLHHILEQLIKRIVIHSWFERDVQWVMLSIICSVLVKSACSGEKILTILMERYRHDSVWQVKCLLNTVTVMDIDIDVNDSWINHQKFQNCQNNIIYVTKSARLWFLSMMKPASKVYGNISLPVQE